MMSQVEDAVTAPLTNKLIDWKITRDSLIWFWGRLTMGALLIGSGLFNDKIQAVIGEKWTGVLTILSVIILWLSGKYDSSPLPGKRN